MTETAQNAAASAAERMLNKKGRRQLTKADPLITFDWARIGIWAPPKRGKTHLGLDAHTTPVYRANPDAGPFAPAEERKGELVIPSKPLSIAFANFDRDANTVLQNLPDDIQVVEEQFFRREPTAEELAADQPGEVLVPVTMGPADFQHLINRFREYVKDAEEAGMELIVVDGGTVLWEMLRRWKLPPTDGDGNRPSEYQQANTEMRTIMSVLKTRRMHVVVTREAREVWVSAGKKAEDAAGNALLTDDGWNKTGHVVDLDVQLLRALRGSANGHVEKELARIHVCIKREKVGMEIENPTFEKLYTTTYNKPLLLHADLEEYTRLRKEGPLIW